MAHQMSVPTNDARMERQMPPQGWEDGGLSPVEPRWDETRYTMPQGWGTPGAQQNWSPPAQGGQSSAFAQSQRMKNPVDMETTHSPGNNHDAYQASLRSLLARNVGYFIVATFLTGAQRMVTWQGILHTVGSDYIVIYQPDYERYISCDFYALKFVQFHNTTNTPFCASSNTWMAQDT